MKRLNIAMLGEQQTQQVVVDQNNEALATDQDMSQIKQADAELDQVSSVIEETQDASDSITQTADKIEQMQTVSQEVVQVAQEQMNYFVKRTGMKMTGVSTAMESFSDGKTGNKEALVKQLRIAAESLDKGVSVAQEGIVDRIKNKFSLLFTSNKKLKQELQDVSSKYDSAGAKKDVIKDPAFARILNPDGKPEITGTSTIALTGNIRNMVKDPVIEKVVVRLTDVLDKVTVTLNKSIFIADDNEVKKINDLFDEVENMYTEVREKITVNGKKESADAVPLDAGDKKKVASIVEDLLDTGAYDKIEKDLLKSWWSFYDIYSSKADSRFIGFNAADMRVAKNLNDKGGDIMQRIDDLMTIRFEVAHACVKYIKASTAN